MPLRMGSCVSCRANRTLHPALTSRLSSTRLHTIHRCVWPYTLRTLGNVLQPSQNQPLLYTRHAAPQIPEFSPLPVPPPRKVRRRPQPALVTGTRATACSCAIPPAKRDRAAREYSAEEEAILAVQLAHGASHEVSSVEARHFAANCASSSAGALSCFASRFSRRDDMSSCAKYYDNNCINIYFFPWEHSHDVVILVCVRRHPKVLGVLRLPSAMSIIVSVLLTCFGVLPGVVFYDAACLLS
jgi:hypothetical protein